MSIFAQAARTLALAAAFACGASANAQPPEPRLAIEARPGTIAGDQAAAAAPESDPDRHGLQRLAVLTPSAKGRGQERSAAPAEPSGVQIMAAPPNEVAAKWDELQPRIRSDQETLAKCRSGDGDCPAAARGFLQIIEQGRERQGRARIGVINRAVNLSIKPLRDAVQHGLEDVWSTPLATFTAGAGDCEDYAIAKYVALRETGTAAADLQLVIARDIKGRTNHAVLAVRFDGEWLLLDNRHMVLVNAGEAPHYSPLFVMDHLGSREFSTAELRR